MLFAVLVVGCGGRGATQPPTPSESLADPTDSSTSPAVAITPLATATVPPATPSVVPTAEPTPIPNVCGEGNTPEDAIAACSVFIPYAGDCELTAERIDGPFCSQWVDRLDDLRLYHLSAPPDAVAPVLLQQRGGAWFASAGMCSVPASRATPDVLCRPSPFQNLRAQYRGVAPVSNGRTEFGVGQIDVLGDGATLRVTMFFRNVGTVGVDWTSDEGVPGIQLVDSGGSVYPSVAVGGHFAENLRQLLPGEFRSGWHIFRVGQPARLYTLSYPGRDPIVIDLTGEPFIRGLASVP